jgi:UDP-N-acetylmuramoyl-tripeptide--D-alanyl-D-alanine ligase
VSAALEGLLLAAAALAWLAVLGTVSLVAARMFQIEEYEATRLLAWGGRRAWLAHRSVLAAGAAPLVAAVLVALAGERDGSRQLVAAAWLVAAPVAILLWRWLPPKKELVFTPRMRRLLAIAATIAALVAGALCAVVALAPSVIAALVVAMVVLGTCGGSMLILVAADEVARPLEAAIRRGFLRRARARLDRVDPLVIAIAGSYGKTSTKHILAHLLQPYGEALATPKSFNTLMGVSRTVNDLLEDRHRTFLVEMDAYAPGEIASICRLVRPRNALVTSVGPQHLERFVTIGRVEDALYETVESLPADGFAVLYAGDAQSAALADRARRDGRNVVTYGMEGDRGDLNVLASDVTITGDGGRFAWCWPAEGLRHQLTVPLLGRHQVLNVSAALATVHLLGLQLQPALDAVATLTAVEHRLQPLPTGNAITVIDDSYNANPVGVHNGLEVLAEMQAGARILVTPGLVELGTVEDAENRRYGEHAARVCDHVIVVEARPGRAFREGLRAGGLGEDRIHVVRSLEEATAVIGRVAAAGDAVLFANDLPDTYLGAV